VLRGVWQALNCLSIHATYCGIVAVASPGETKMWAAVRENGDFITVVNYTIFAAVIDSFMSVSKKKVFNMTRYLYEVSM